MVSANPASSAAVTRADLRERRRSNRIPTTTAATLSCADLPCPLRVQVFDVSLHGVGFKSTQRLDSGLEFDIEIGNGPMYLTGRIRITSVRARRDGTFDTGAEFV